MINYKEFKDLPVGHWFRLCDPWQGITSMHLFQKVDEKSAFMEHLIAGIEGAIVDIYSDQCCYLEFNLSDRTLYTADSAKRTKLPYIEVGGVVCHAVRNNPRIQRGS